MIQEFKVRNYLSFKDETSFSFLASNDSFSEDCQVVRMANGTRLLRLAIVYGFNASGKTNLLKAINFLIDFCLRPHTSVDEPTGAVPFKLEDSAKSKPSSFELVFFAHDMKYSYVLELDEKQVYYEKLSCYKSVQPTLLFERTIENGQSVIYFNPGADKISPAVKEQITINCLRNVSVFVARSKVNTSLPLIDGAMEWFGKYTMPMIYPSTKLTSFAQEETMTGASLKEQLIGFLRDADFNITNVRTENGETSKKNTFFEHTVERDGRAEKYYMKQDEESIGTIRTFGLETAIIIAQKEGAFLPVDELETSLHPKLQERILFDYLQTSSRSQIIATTHNDGLLDLTDDLIRKDSVWFTEKDNTGATELYRLSDFRGLNRLSSIRDAYRNKRFGATMK